MRITTVLFGGLASLALIASVTPLNDAREAGGPAAAAVTADEAYACRSDIFPVVEDTSPAGGHVAGVVEAGNGDLLYTFNSTWLEGPHATTKWGTGPVTRVYLARLPAGSDTWTAPQRIDYPRPHQVHNAVLWHDGADTLYMFFTVLEGQDHTESTLEVMTSTDDGHTWSEPRAMREEWGWMFGTRPFRMSNGEVLLPVYREVSPNGAGFLISSDGFQTWETHPSPDTPWPGSPFAIMASVVELDPGHLLAYLRANGGQILQARSLDYGRTWTPAHPTGIESPWARVALLKLDSGNLVLAHNPDFSNRAPLRVALSEDDGVTWNDGVLVETDPDNRFDYPYLFQSTDGAIHLGYTHNNKQNMRHVVFNEEYVRSGVDIPTDTAYSTYEVSGGTVSQVDTCAYVNGDRIVEIDDAYACRRDLYRPQPDTYPYSAHVAGMIENADGDLLFHFDGNTDIPDVVNRPEWTIARMALSRMPRGSGDWSFPEMVDNPADPDSTHNTVLFDDGEGRIHNFFTTREGRSHSASALDYRYSDDGGGTWSFPVRIREEHGWMFGNRPFRMSNGEAIVPVYRETSPGGVGFFISGDNFALDDDGKPTYEIYPSENHTLWPGSNAIGLQGATIELEPGHLVSFMRTNARLIYRTDSLDYGRTWTPAVPTQFPNPWSRVDLLKTDTGNLILAYNPSTSDRTPLNLALSEDGGLTWPYEITIEGEPTGSFDYPYLIQSSDGAIHLGYTHNPPGPLRNMRHMVFNEDFIRAGVDMPSDGEDVIYEYKEGALGTTEACLYVNGEGVPTPAKDVGAYACRQDLEPQNPDHPGVHVAALEEAPNGELMYIFYAGSAEGQDDVRTFMSRMAVGSEGWTQPEVVFDEPNQPDGNAVLWVDDETGRIHLLFSTIRGNGWTQADLRRIWSDDGGETWSDPVFVREDWGWLFGTLPFRMSNGEVIVPIYSETEWRSGWYISDDGLETLTPYPSEDDTTWPGTDGGSIQPATVELDPGHLLAVLRTRSSGGQMYQTESFDYGRSWSEVEPNGLPQNNSRIALIKLDDGTLVMAYNPVSSGRTPLSLSYSTDNGQTWSEPQNIEDDSGSGLPFIGPEFSYPYLLQTSDGLIHLGYTHRRDTMRSLTFNKEFLLGGMHLPSNESQTEKTEYRNGSISQVALCSFGLGLPLGEDVAYACRQDIHPQDPNFPGVHVATLEEAPNGDLLYGFYAGSQEKADDVKTYMGRLEGGTAVWRAPEVVFDEPDKPDGNAVLWTDDDNDRVHLMFSTIQDDGWTEADLRIITSEDDGVTWSEPRYIREEWGWLFGTLPFRMSNGELIVPIYSEVEWSSGWYISDDDAQTFTPYPSDDDTTWPRSLAGMIQPATVELEPGHLVAFNRSRDFHIWRTESFDYGRTWSTAVPTTLPNNNSRVALLKTRSGDLILAHNPTRSGRSPLRLSMSTDGGETWPYEVDIEGEAGEEFSYPYLLQTTDGMLHLGYTHRRESMRHLVFNERFVMTGPDLASDNDFTTRYEYAGGELTHPDACGYAPPDYDADESEADDDI